MYRMMILVMCLSLQVGCESVVKVLDRGEEHGETFALDNRDFEYAAYKAVQSFLASPKIQVRHANNPWILAMSRVTNDTTLHFDTDQLVKKIRVALQESQSIRVTTAVSAGGAEEGLVRGIRELRDDDIFDASTIASKGTVIAPELSLSGKIIQRLTKIGRDQKSDYYFQLTITELKTGLSFWEFEEVIVKLNESSTFPW